ncbi:hypothetical protein RO3G_10179 [Rhizopus delemar RA 99-880]|uniref:Uncharacterized protein n=1 Tax=Rhizopus delemar (strain RA 99-880 / ATCC MYA-4621 / FGSC 9543 / NRRL 43880) TaxID=246409 RepID=I1CAI9_RHIO9|nr:hypothetical protein RO3G_10179 [Rhizopus delemar RA 99-880]|eukprot:EIE85469.1 hypothetical protein RO3G_10179 [Rhizopus delemar RA 99-880]
MVFDFSTALVLEVDLIKCALHLIVLIPALAIIDSVQFVTVDDLTEVVALPSLSK